MPRIPKPWFREERQAYFVKIRKVCHNLGPDKEEATRRFHELMAAPPTAPVSRETPSVGISVAELLDKFLCWCEQHRSKRSLEWYGGHLQSFCKAIKFATTLTPTALKSHHLQDWVDQPAHAKWGANQKRGAIIAVQRPFNWAVKLGYIDKNPVAGVEKPSPTRREEFINPMDFQEMISEIDEGNPFRDLLMFMWETGCRPQEARHLEARHFNRTLGRFEIPPLEAKGKKRWRIIRLTATALAIAERRMKDGATKIFSNGSGTPWTAGSINCRFQRLKKRTGLAHCAYEIRHSFANRLLVSGIDHLTVAELMGHADGKMLAMTYQHLDQSNEHLQNALNGDARKLV